MVVFLCLSPDVGNERYQQARLIWGIDTPRISFFITRYVEYLNKFPAKIREEKVACQKEV